MIAEARSPDKLPGLATFYNSQSSPAPRRSHPEPAAPGRSKIPALPEGLSQAGFLAPTDIVWAGKGSDNGRRTQCAATGRSGAAPAVTAAGLANPPRWVGALPQRSRSGTISASSAKNEQSAHATRHTRTGVSRHRFSAAHALLVGVANSR